MRQAISILGGGDCSTKAKWFVHIHITIIDQIPDLNSELSTSGVGRRGLIKMVE